MVIIGGQSRSSRLHGVTHVEATCTAIDLRDEGKASAIPFLEEQGYETGQSKRNDNRRTTGGKETEAGRLQRQAEEDGFDEIGHEESLRIGNRLLKNRGHEGAMEWFREFHPNFDPEITPSQLRSIAEKFSDISQ